MKHQVRTPGRRRFQPVLILAGIGAAAVLSLSMSGTLSAFAATITNSTNTAASGSVILQETGANSTSPIGASVTCTSTDANSADLNSATCATINKYGGNLAMVPATSGSTTNLVTTTETFKNTGTATAASFILAPGACTQSANGVVSGTASDFCAKLNVVIAVNGVVVQTTTAAALAQGGPITLPAVPAPGGPAVTLKFTVSIDSSAGNSYQGLAASQPLVWTLSS